MDKKYQVFVSSTYTDLKDEREDILKVLMKLNCIPAGMELFPAIDEEQFEYIKKIIDDSDFYLLIIGGRYGSLDDTGISYTEKEFDYAFNKKLKIIALIHEDIKLIPSGKVDTDSILRAKLEAFKNKASRSRLVDFWKTKEQLSTKVSTSVSMSILEFGGIGWVRGDREANPKIYEDYALLQKENIELKGQLKSKVNDFENIAELDDIIDFNVSFFYSETPNDFSYEDTIDISFKLKMIFNYFSASLFSKNLIEEAAKNLLNRMFTFYIKKNNDKIGQDYYVYINSKSEDLLKIKIQLKALGLVDFETTTDTSIWYLTEKGINLYMRERVIKKEIEEKK